MRLLLRSEPGRLVSQWRDARGETLLHLCANAGTEAHAAVAESLIASGADVNAHTHGGGWTPLHYAARRGCAPGPGHDRAAERPSLTQALSAWALVQALLDAGVDVNADDAAGAPAVFVAAREGHAEVLHLLLHSGGAQHPRVLADAGALHDALEAAQRRATEQQAVQEEIQRLPRGFFVATDATTLFDPA